MTNTPNESQSTELKPSRWTIKLKLILINSLVISIALGTMIYIATLFFLNDSEDRVKENLEQVTDTIGSRVKSDFTFLSEKIQLITATMEEDFSDSNKREMFLNLFFKEDKSFLMVGIFSVQEEGLKEISVQFNKEFLRDNELNESDFRNLISIHSKSIQRTGGGQAILTNTSPGIKVPSFALSIPYGRETGKIVVAIVHLNRIKDTFEKKNGIMETFLINDEGTIVAHPDETTMFTAKEVIDSPVVQNTLKNQLERGQVRFKEANGEFYLGSFKKIGMAGASVISYVPEAKAFEAVYKIRRINIYILGIALCLAILVIYNFSITITKPLLKLVEATQEVKGGNFNPQIKPANRDEVGILTSSFLGMAKGLEEREKVKSILGNMIDPVVVQEAMIDFAALKRGSERQITAFFSDVAGFSTISEKLNSVELASLLNEYLGSMTIILKKYEGVLDKYIGDAIVGIFNAPIDINNPSISAAKASLEMIRKLEELKAHWKSQNLYIPEAHEMQIRIGLNSGPAKVGFMGSDALASYTMMGDTVNLAARLEAAAKDYGVSILISESIKKQIDSELFTRELDQVRVKGKNDPVLLYELIGLNNEITAQTQEATELYEKAFRKYLDMNWDESIQLLKDSIKIRGSEDKAAKLLIERCLVYKNNPPGDDWDGVFTRTHK